MGEQRRRKSGIIIFAGAELYNLRTDTVCRLQEDINIKDWQTHVGHIRFGYKDSRYSFETKYNKKQYEIQYD